MKRAIGIMVLLAFALAVPGTNICAAKTAEGIAISTLDVCSQDAPGTTGSFITLIEPVFNIQTAAQVAELPCKEPLIFELTVFPPIDKPPVS